MHRLFIILFCGALSAQQPTFDRSDLRDLSPGAQVVSLDFNLDGKLDLATISNRFNPLRAELVVQFGNGDGTFWEVTRTEFSGNSYDLITADVNGDGKPDLITSKCCERVSWVVVWLGDGQGGFTPGKEIYGGPAPANGSPPSYVEGIAVADLNGDRKPDLVIQVIDNLVEGAFYILLGRGDGTFDIQPTHYGTYLSKFLVTDLNRDRIPDLAYSPGLLDVPAVLLGNGDGTFRYTVPLPLTVASYFSDFGGSAIATGDFDQNGIIDLAIRGEGVFAILLGNGDGTFHHKTDLRSPDRLGVIQIMVADLNGDNKPDLLVSYFPGGSWAVRQGKGDGTFEDGVPLGMSSYDLVVPAIADLNGDGRVDLIMSNRADSCVSAMLNATPAQLADPSLVSATGFVTQGFAPGMLISIYGSFLAPLSSGPPALVRVNGMVAPILFISPGQINAQLPMALAPGPAQLEVENRIALLATDITIVEFAPAIFTLNQASTGPGLILHADGTAITASAPARVGESVTILCTGLGRLGQNPQVTIGGVPGFVRSYGVAPFAFLIHSVEVVIPDGVPTGSAVPVELTIGGVKSNSVTVHITNVARSPDEHALTRVACE